jgi:hypothetical protein
MCARKTVTETSDELICMATGDITGVLDRLNGKYGFKKVDRILSVSALQIAVEKILKGYLRKNNIIVYHGHNLLEYYHQSHNIDKSFNSIKKNIVNLNRFDAARKYNLTLDVNDNIIMQSLKDIQNIYLIKPIQDLYDDLVTRSQGEKLPSQIFDDMIERFNEIVTGNEIKTIDCLKHQYSNNAAHVLMPEERKNLLNCHYIKIPGNDDNSDLNIIAYEYKTDNGGKKYYLEKLWRNNSNENYQSNLWQIKEKFNDISALEFVKQFENWEKEKQNSNNVNLTQGNKKNR